MTRRNMLSPPNGSALNSTGQIVISFSYRPLMCFSSTKEVNQSPQNRIVDI